MKKYFANKKSYHSYEPITVEKSYSETTSVSKSLTQTYLKEIS